MRHKKLLLSKLIILVLGLKGLYAQQAIPTSGGNNTGEDGNVCYSIGQLVYTTNTGSDGSVAQGVLQPYEISVLIDETNGTDIECFVFPNPTNDFLTIKVENVKEQNLVFQLCDMNGSILQKGKLTLIETPISMTIFTPSTYFLTVSVNNKVLKSFKIIKNYKP